jgi:SAM-dependent methyltransferase
VTFDQLEQQKQSFDKLVDRGIYSAHFDHGAPAKTFVGDIIRDVVAQCHWNGAVNVLDCGCGTGAWLDFLCQHLRQAGFASQRPCGFDLSQRMIDVAHERLRNLVEVSDIREGTLLDPSSYSFAGLADGFDLVFTYDVVQQLPRARQFDACFTIVSALAPGGVALIFDNDAETRFGRRMAIRKFLTRYFGLKLVPRYFCNAAYPQLENIRLRLTSETSLKAEIVVRADGIKRCLIVRRCTPERTHRNSHSKSGQGRTS